MIDFSWSDEQLALKESIIKFAREELNDDVITRDREGQFSKQLWQKCADFGIQGLPIPSAYGGRQEVDHLTTILAMEGLGYGCKDNGLAFALNAHMWAIQVPIINFGSEKQKQKWLPRLSQGLIGAHGISEPEAGSDVYSLRTEAQKCEGGYLLNGRKKYISLGPIADVALVFATLSLELGKWGITAFIVEQGSQGFQSGPVEEKMGLRTVPFGEFFFEDCFVPEENRLGPEGAGASISHYSLEWERSCILASQLGTMERQLEETVDYANQRRQFGQAIGKFQSVSNRVADMKLRLETARLLLYKVAWLRQNGKSTMIESALLKLHLSESFFASSVDAVRIHGGKGYLTEAGIERNLRDSVGGLIYAGTSDIQRQIIARLLGL